MLTEPVREEAPLLHIGGHPGTDHGQPTGNLVYPIDDHFHHLVEL